MYVPCEVGFWDDVFTKTFCTNTKNPRGGEAIMRLREFVLLTCDDHGRLPKKYQIEHIRASMGVTCTTRALAKALTENHFLERRRRTWCYSDFQKTPIGVYFREKLRGKQHKAEMREKARLAALEVAGNGDASTLDGRPGDGRVTGSRKSRSSKEGRPPDGPPGAPQGGVSGDVGATRWEWFKSVYPRISSPEKCTRLLAKLSPEEWEHLQWSLPQQAASGRYQRNNMRFCPRADLYLQRKQFLEIRRGTAPKSKPPGRPKKGTAKPVDELAAKKSSALRFLLEQLADPHLSERKKQKVKEHWRTVYGDEPWEKASGRSKEATEG